MTEILEEVKIFNTKKIFKITFCRSDTYYKSRDLRKDTEQTVQKETYKGQRRTTKWTKDTDKETCLLIFVIPSQIFLQISS